MQNIHNFTEYVFAAQKTTGLLPNGTPYILLYCYYFILLLLYKIWKKIEYFITFSWERGRTWENRVPKFHTWNWKSEAKSSWKGNRNKKTIRCWESWCWSRIYVTQYPRGLWRRCIKDKACMYCNFSRFRNREKSELVVKCKSAQWMQQSRVKQAIIKYLLPNMHIIFFSLFWISHFLT